MILNETFLAKPVFEEISREDLPDGVLCRVSYPICDIGQKNANGRVYEDAVWEKVLGEKELKEKLANRALFGHAEHPEQTQSNLEKTSHVIFEMWKDNGQVWQKFDVFDTPTGRIVDCLLKSCRVGCSTRAEGDLEEAEDDEGTFQRVIPESYRYVTTDFTADPSTFGSIPHDIQRNVVSKVEKELKNEKLNGTERQFAQLIFEAMKCQGSKCVVEGVKKIAKKVKEKKTMKEGTWSHPYTQEKAQKLATLMENPINPKEATDKLYDLVGDDILFDSFHEAEDNKVEDVRPEVRSYIKEILERYNEKPEDFKQKFEDEALEILQSMIVEKKTVLDLINDKLIQVDKVVEYKNQRWKVSKVEETAVSLAVGTVIPTIVSVNGDAAISVSPEGLITILPTEALTELGQKEPKEAEPEQEAPSEEEIEGEMYSCECLKCGHTMESKQHCRDIKCPECGGEMRRKERPGVGQVGELPERKVMGPKDTIEVGNTIEIGATVKLTKEVLETYRRTHHEAYKVDWVRNIKFDENGITEGKVTKIEEGSIAITLDDGTVVRIEDPTSVDIIVSAPPPAEEIEPVGPPEEEIVDMEAAGPLPVEDDIPEEEFESKVDEDREGLIRQLTYSYKRYEKELASPDPEKQAYAEKKVASIEKTLEELGYNTEALFKESKVKEAKLPTEGGVSDKVAPGNLLQDKEGKDWTVKEATDAGLTVTQPGEPGTEKFISWDKVDDYSFTKVSEEKVDESKIVLKAKEVDGEASWTSDPTEIEGMVDSGLEVDIIFKSDDGKEDHELLSNLIGQTLVIGDKEVKVKESKVDEATSVEKDGEWFVESPGGAILGGPYKSKVEADKRKKNVEFYAASKESKVDEGLQTWVTRCTECGWKEANSDLQKCPKCGAPTEQDWKFESKVDESKMDEDEWNDLDSSKLSEVSLNEPAGFDSCVDRGGRVRTVSGEEEHGLESGEYVKYCFIDKKSYRGEVHKKESEAKLEESMPYEEALKIAASPEDYMDDQISSAHHVISDEKVTDENKEDIKKALANLGYAIGRRKSESISTTAKEIKDLRVEEASTRAERDKAIELLEEITDEKKQLAEKVRKEKAFEVKILVNKIGKTLEAKEQEVDALRAKLEEKAKLTADTNKQLEEQKKLITKTNEQMDDVVSAATVRVTSLKESASVIENKHQKDLLEAKKEYQKKLNSITKINETKIEKTKEETEKRVNEEVTKEFIKSFIEFKLSETTLKVDDNSQALLEKCKSLGEVEELLDEIIDVGRRSALHSESITDIHVSKAEITDPETVEAERAVGSAYEGMNSLKG